MNQADEFFKSVRDAFAPGAGLHVPPGWLAAFGGILVLAWAIARFARRHREARTLQGLARDRGLSADDLDLVVRLAKRSHAAPAHVLTRVAVFDHVTAEALANEAPARAPATGSLPWQLRQLRRTLGFDVIPAHHWLLTTRELLDGDELDVGGARARVTGVNELSFTARFEDHEPAIGPREGVVITVIRPDEARYRARCRVLEAGGGELLLAHDESLERVQLRDSVRVRVNGDVAFTPVRQIAARSPAVVRGAMHDVSAGGLSIDVSTGITGPSVALCTFTLAEGERFENIAAKVLDGKPSGRDRFRVRLAFTGLPDAELSRIVRAVAWHERHGPDVAKKAGGAGP